MPVGPCIGLKRPLRVESILFGHKSLTRFINKNRKKRSVHGNETIDNISTLHSDNDYDYD